MLDARTARAHSSLNEVTSAIARLRTPCRGGRMCSWLEATSVSHKEAAINIHSEVVQKYTASTTAAEAFSGPPPGLFRKGLRGTRFFCDATGRLEC